MTLRLRRDPPLSSPPSTLIEVRPGGWARVAGFEGLPAPQRERLQAYGLTEGRPVYVVQHTPVMVVQVENTELAFEAELAHGVRVEAVR